MRRQNPRRPTEPAGDNPEGRTRGFHFKIPSQSSASCGKTFSSYQSQPMAFYTATMTGPSHPQDGANTTSAAATYLQAVASSAISDAGTHRLATNVPAASGLNALGALFRTPVTQRETREAPKDFVRHSDPGGSATAHQVRHFSPRLRLQHSPDSILDRPRRSRERDLTVVSDSPRNASPSRGTRAAPSAASGPSSGGPSCANSPDRLQARLEAMCAEERRVDALLSAKQQDLQAINDRVCAEEDRAQREALQHQRDVIAFQAKANRLSQEHQDRMAHF